MSSSSTPPKVIKALCSTCSLRELCLPVGLMQDEVNQLDAVIRQSRRLKKGSIYFGSLSRLNLFMRFALVFLKQL